MKTAPWLVAAAFTFTSLSLVAQHPDAGSRPSVAASAGVKSAAEFHSVPVELLKKLDAKKAKPGDPVTAKTLDKLRIADGTELPRGTRLIGHVTEAQAHRKGHAASSLGIVFDRAELRSGESLAIRSTIQSIAPPPAPERMASMAQASASGPPAGGMNAGAGGMNAGSASAGGDLGGATLLNGSGAVMGVGSSVESGSGHNPAATADQGVNATVQDAPGGAVHLASGGAAAMDVHAGAGVRASAIPGITLGSDAGGGASGVFQSANRNVELDSGTRMVLDISPSPSF